LAEKFAIENSIMINYLELDENVKNKLINLIKPQLNKKILSKIVEEENNS
jgi:hypothetical protein